MELVFMENQFPIGPLQVPENVTNADVQTWLEKISSYTERLEKVALGLSEEELAKKYRQNSWTVKQLVHHIADSQLNMFQRLKLALTDNNPTVPAFNQDKWAVQPDTSSAISSSIRMLEGINERIVNLGTTLTEEQLQRKFTHEQNGEITVAIKLAKLAWHQEHHLEHIKIALTK